MTADLLQQLDAYGGYVDGIVSPITETEVELRSRRVPDYVASGPLRSPGWMVAVAAAAVVVMVVGGMAWLFGGSDGSAPPADEPAPTVPTETVIEGVDPSDETPASLWMNNRWGVMLSVAPPLLPPVPGTFEVTVHGFHAGEQNGVWVTSCPGAKGVVDVDLWEPTDDGIGALCALGEDHPVATGDFIDGVFETTIRIDIDESAIEDGGVVITAGDIWVPVAGNVLLRITDQPSTAWEGAQGHLNLPSLFKVIRYWPPFVQNFNTIYDELGSCDDAYASAQNGQSGYLNASEEWDDTQRDKPGYVYDMAVARLLASERWLYDHTCPGRLDFISVG